MAERPVPSNATSTSQNPATDNTAQEKVRARLLADHWPTSINGNPIRVSKGDVVTIFRSQFDSMNDNGLAPTWEEVKEEG